MKISSFDYDLPDRLVAQVPAAIRDEARLLVLDRRQECLQHALFRDLPDFLHPGDVLVLNDTRVFPARLLGKKTSGGGRVEVLFVREIEPGLWEALARSPGRPGTEFEFPGGFRGIWLGGGPEGKGRIQFHSSQDLNERIEEVGCMPLPPYIARNCEKDLALDKMDRDRYQTVYARHRGSVAAPTAGLHFTNSLLERLRSHGIDIVFITLHVGIGAFLPVRSEEVGDHCMEPERYLISSEAAEKINAVKASGKRLVTVGTTTTRLLESQAKTHRGKCVAGCGETDLFITPGYRFEMVEALITNFHLPRSTPLLLASAFAGWERIREAYEEAMQLQYRFYSYGDSMLIL